MLLSSLLHQKYHDRAKVVTETYKGYKGTLEDPYNVPDILELRKVIKHWEKLIRLSQIEVRKARKALHRINYDHLGRPSKAAKVQKDRINYLAAKTTAIGSGLNTIQGHFRSLNGLNCAWVDSLEAPQVPEVAVKLSERFLEILEIPEPEASPEYTDEQWQAFRDRQDVLYFTYYSLTVAKKSKRSEEVCYAALDGLVREFNHGDDKTPDDVLEYLEGLVKDAKADINKPRPTDLELMRIWEWKLRQHRGYQEAQNGIHDVITYADTRVPVQVLSEITTYMHKTEGAYSYAAGLAFKDWLEGQYVGHEDERDGLYGWNYSLDNFECGQINGLVIPPGYYRCTIEGKGLRREPTPADLKAYGRGRERVYQDYDM